jgi:hypothetical protein
VLVTDRDCVLAELGRPVTDRSRVYPDAFLLGSVRPQWITGVNKPWAGARPRSASLENAFIKAVRTGAILGQSLRLS